MLDFIKKPVSFLQQKLCSIKRKEFLLLSNPRKINQQTVFVNMKNIAFISQVWEGESTSDDPQIYLYDDLTEPLDSSEYRFIEFSLFVNKSMQGQLIWWISDDRWQTSCSFQINKGWHKYRFDMKTIPTTGIFSGSGIGWEGLVSKLRLDPAEEVDVTIKVKNIKCAYVLKSKLTHVPNSSALIENQFKQKGSVNVKENYEDYKSLPLVVKSKPVLIYAEISTKCNLRCRMCGRYNYDIPFHQQGFMDRKIFLELSKLFTPGAQLALFGRGETLLHPDFIYFLEVANKANIKIGFNTNGLLLTSDIARAMVENKQTHVVFSCSAGTPETYSKIHGTDAWHKLWANINLLNEAKSKYGLCEEDMNIKGALPVIYLEFVSQLSNISELPALLRRAFSYSLNGLMVIDLTAHSDAMEKERMNTPENIALADKYYKDALRVYEEMIEATKSNFDFRLPSSYFALTKKFASIEEKQMLSGVKECGNNFCLEPWMTFYVRFDGTVAPCVITGRKLGDLNINTAEEIWNGEIYQKFRNKMKEEIKPYECLHCHLFPGPKRYDIKLGDSSIYESL
jgi:radical SAM protein with 4Fe4S-binding SPASM domain